MTDTYHHLYFIGIKGVGMSALAIVAKGLGYEVSGSDVDEDFITDHSLDEAGITVQKGFSADHINENIDLIIIGAAYNDTNPEVRQAHRLGLACWTYSQLLGHLSRQKKTVAIAGTHGKTTTTSLLSFLLYKTAQQPSFIIGTGQVADLPSHGYSGKGEFFVVEADDYKRAPDDPKPKFLDLAPSAAIITSIEHDHPDMYPSLKDCVEAFYQFALRLKPGGFLVVNADDPNIKKLRARLADRRFISYGFNAQADYQIKLIRTKAGEPPRFRLLHNGQASGPFTLQLQGTHNIYNATAAVVMALELGTKEEAIKKLLPTFMTVERRYQLVGQVGEQIIIDDYAHHPTAVALTLATAKKQYRGYPVWCLFQSHTYSRTKALLKEFGKAFADADVVLVTDIFASAREQEITITTPELVAEIGKHHKNVMYVSGDKLVDFITKNLPPKAILITMGAGDIYKVGRKYLANKS